MTMSRSHIIHIQTMVQIPVVKPEMVVFGCIDQWQVDQVEWGAVGWNSHGLDGGTCILLSLELFGSIFGGRCVVVMRPI